MTANNSNTSPFIPSSIAYAKTKAKHVRALVRQIVGTSWSLALSQQTTAKAMGHDDWHALETAVKQTVPTSLTNADSTDAVREARWQAQSGALRNSGVPIGDVAPILAHWKLTGDVVMPSGASAEQLAYVLDTIWPQDTRQLALDVQLAVRGVVIVAVGDLLRQEPSFGDLRRQTFADVLDVPYSESMAAARASGRSEGHITTLRQELREHFFRGDHDAVHAVDADARSFMLGYEGQFAHSEVTNGLRRRIVDRLFDEALASHGRDTLWQLFFNRAGPDGLISYYNNRQDFELTQLTEGDEGDDSDPDESGEEYMQNTDSRCPHPPQITSVPQAEALTVSILNKPRHNEFDDLFRLTTIRARLREHSGDNVGFISAVLIEAFESSVSRVEFLDVCDSESQEMMELAEAVVHDVPEMLYAFETGAYLHVFDCELATRYRGRGFATTLIMAVIEHARTLSGDVTGLGLDVMPLQFPWTRYDNAPDAIRQELEGANNKLREHASRLLRQSVFKGIEHKMVRTVYPSARGYAID